jgi:Ca2+-binding EF-hand superfamily protein
MSTLFEITANDIFKKFDMLLTRELGYLEFKGFYECVGKDITEAEFDKILDAFSSTKAIHKE